MALHMELPAAGSHGGREMGRPQEVVVRPLQAVQQSSGHDWRLANDYVQTPPRLTQKICLKDMTPKPNELALPVGTPDVRADPKENADPPLPTKLNGSSSGGGSWATTSASGSCSGRSICPKCHRCRCVKCTGRRELPRSWCGSCECSADRTVDCVTCMCCVRASFYHCCSDAEEISDYADNPCGCCDYPRCFVRWIFIVIVSLFLPCLLLYWPFRGCVALATECYNGCANGGCRCARDNHPAAMRPLIEAENSSI